MNRVVFFFVKFAKDSILFTFFLLAKIVFFFIKMKDGISYFKDPHILTQNNDLKHVFLVFISQFVLQKWVQKSSIYSFRADFYHNNNRQF